MASAEEAASKQDQVTLEGGTYEIIRNRLLANGKELKSRLDKLNQARKDIFGSIEPSLIATERISTHNNCMPRDMISLNGTRFIFGYNVHMGLRSETLLSDVFAIYEYRDHAFHELPLDIFNSGRFHEDFKNLYKYYKGTQFAKFSVIGPNFFMVFQAGKSATDIKTFKWALQDGDLTYVDNRSDHEFKFPPQHDFTWKKTTRDWHRYGEHPHISVEDRVFVEAVGGDITFKVEDNTESGQGIYAEPVDHADQTLDDAEIHYAIQGHIILVRIRPYQEEKNRYFIFNEKTQEVCRADEIENACVLLPDDHGLIFSNGYYLQTGELKQFESSLTNMMFERRLASANGEDFLYVFYNRESGDHILLSYNLIEQKVETPIVCNGFSNFDSGEMLFFRADEEPSKHHVVQIWQTPYVGGDYAFSEKHDSFLYKIGNPNIVRCMAECNELLKILNKEDVYAGLYMDLVKKATDVSDTYFWLDKEEAFKLKHVILQVKDTAAGAIDEFEKVVRIRKNTVSEVARVSARAREILDKTDPGLMNSIDLFVSSLSDLRGVRGEIISLKDLRYADLPAVESLETEVSEATDNLSGLCAEFLLKPEALEPYENHVAEIGESIDKLEKVSDAKAVEEKADASSGELEMLIEIVSNLRIEDSTQTTRIIENISGIYSKLNQIRAGIKNKKKSLRSVEGVAQFNAQVKLLNQSVINYLDICDTPERCDEYLTKVMIQVEELEGRFADFDDFIAELSEKRDELYNAFESKKLNLVEARNKRANTLASSAERILKGIQNRVGTMEDINAINGYFASDLMIEKVRDIVSQLLELNDSVKADDIQARLKTIREDAVRQLKDRQELYVDGANVIQFGDHKFSVNVQPLDLTIVQRDGQQMFHLTGTNFFEPIDDEDFLATHTVWDMEVPSESKTVYRAEYLAFQMLKDNGTEDGAAHREWDSDEDLLTRVQQYMGPRYTEGYTKGIHDHDSAKIFTALAGIHTSVGLLRFHPRVRALGRLFWTLYPDETNKGLIASKLKSFGMMSQLFPGQEKQENYIHELEELLRAFAQDTGLFSPDTVADAADYLFHELVHGEVFVVSREASEIVAGFAKHLRSRRFAEKFRDARAKLATVPVNEFELVRDWTTGYVDALGQDELSDYTDEASALIFTRKGEVVSEGSKAPEVSMSSDIRGMVGDHGVVREGIYYLNYHKFMEKLTIHETKILPLFNQYHSLKKELTDKMREDMRLDEFKPRILTSFVRNKLINQVYLSLVGDNFAKQMGVAGESKRTDLMGMLLLISPPGYGKTTLMEYIANRLGIIFMKINGPAIGYNVTSLDPGEAPNASAREEVQKLNLSLEMGDNVMLYLDDIQHCNPELLQKFISLCDAQRKIEGVYKGKTRTYDLRGRKVAVVMAGNPYTESGEKFKVPDMLANRADTYNLGDIIGDTYDVFVMSYLENALTSNPILSKLSSRSQEDVYSIIRIAETGTREGVEFAGTYSAEEVNEMVSVMEKMIKVRDIILKVNKEYIYSAGQADEYRTEPAFKLQGSYRNMNRICEKIVPIMNEDELKTLVLSGYENEAQTLTTGSEANMLKFKELTGWMNNEEKVRWEDIRKTFKKNQLLRGADASDPVTRVVAQLSAFQEGLESIKDVLATGMSQLETRNPEPETGDPEKAVTRVSFSDETLSKLENLAGSDKGMAQISLADETLSKLEKLIREMKPVSVISSPVSVVSSQGSGVSSTGSGLSDSEDIRDSGPIAPSTLRTIHKMPRNYFYMSIKKGEIESVEELLDKGQNPNIKTSEGATALMATAVHNHPEITRLLIGRGADTDLQDKDGYTALMIASCKGRAEVARILLNTGADASLKDKDGLTALMWAQKNGHQDIVRLLEGE